MKAAVLQGVKQLEVIDWAYPKPAEKEVVIKVKSCGICGTDQHIYHGHPGSAEVHTPIVLGHELAGEVVEIGSEVTNLEIGDRVSIDPNIYCGTCKYCRSNRAHLCDHLQAVGVTRDGGMGEYCTVPAANCYPFPDNLTFEEGSLIEPLGCVLHGFKKIQLSPLSRVLIIGGGFIGQLFLQLVKQQHVQSIIVSEPAENKKDLLYRLGADQVINPFHSSKLAADVVIECVGRPESMELAVRSAAKGGQVLLFGVAAPETVMMVSPFEIFSKELTIKGSFVNPFTHEEAISLIEKGVVDVKSLISHRFTVDELPKVMGDFASLHVSKAVILYE
ncbi:zinc-dependent alcohol dehydrogenase family protein [Neobacillus sp. OS1-32]|jgi:L-iditol 2-dehydrogenase|uniref:Zinc-dependent alcohol dehydrogenase family protein n=1 Tax=Neobacillus paridis TaxID=2803862 RepID=A0ABS1TU03_9BACI|nr:MULTISPECIES: zinc-dependent alcohol dehydrogenase family protein [Neobacillus]MBL4954752.1 zinc-dependent alcohol dehydrogenase family protein [Neobacillus paridis]WML29830.1 zinc-dependent alcohol dehydrogenase family protein [Neobacillus sp. OS1-32]